MERLERVGTPTARLRQSTWTKLLATVVLLACVGLFATWSGTSRCTQQQMPAWKGLQEEAAPSQASGLAAPQQRAQEALYRQALSQQRDELGFADRTSKWRTQLRGAAATAAAAAARPPIPRIIHQTTSNRSALPCKAVKFMESWRRLNPGYQHILHDDADCQRLVAEHYPQLLPLYDAFLTPVERSDLWRMLILHHQGGYYADIDVECMRPISSWPQQYPAGQQPGLITGVEAAIPEAELSVKIGFRHPFQLTNWMLAAAPGHPALWAHVLSTLNNTALSLLRLTHSTQAELAQLAAKQGANETADAAEAHARTKARYQDSVVARTGPVSWSDTVSWHLGVNETQLAAMRAGKAVMLGDVQVLPKKAFAAPGYPTSPARPHDEGVLVWHRFFGSWKASNLQAQGLGPACVWPSR